MKVLIIVGLTLALAACVVASQDLSDERIRQQVSDDHTTCLKEGQPGSSGYQSCREQLILARREEMAKSRGRGPESPLYKQ